MNGKLCELPIVNTADVTNRLPDSIFFSSASSIILYNMIANIAIKDLLSVIHIRIASRHSLVDIYETQLYNNHRSKNTSFYVQKLNLIVSEGLMKEYFPYEKKRDELAYARMNHAKAIARAGGVRAARECGVLAGFIDTTVSEALILGLMLQDVKKFLVVLGHGTTEIGEVLRIYQTAGLVRVFPVRNELEASHAATALRWVTGEKAAVVTSIGPGALQALAASLVPVSNGIGLWYLMGDETTEDEGPNMQQIPHEEQSLFLKLCSHMGATYQLHTPLALPTALRRGLCTVDHPHRGGPFFLLLPMNVQPMPLVGFNLDELPEGAPPRLGAAGDHEAYSRAMEAILTGERVLVRLGGGARGAEREIHEFLELADGVAVVAPVALGVLPDDHPRNMTVGGAKGSLSGNYAMDNADVVVVIGSRAVCQSDSSRTGYPKATQVININTDVDDAMHYGKSIALVGDSGSTLRKLNDLIRAQGGKTTVVPSPWLRDCSRKRMEWNAFRTQRYATPTLLDEVWGRQVLTQPAAIKIALDWAQANTAVSFFDAGDVQANGFQIAENKHWGQTITDGGASYMGFAASALLATAIAHQPFFGIAFSGDGSFTMNPQILIDGVQHGAWGCILVFDNRRMAAISGLQAAQYGKDFATNDQVEVDYVAWARAVKGVEAMHGGYSPESLRNALDRAKAHHGLTLIHIPVYYGPDELGGMGVFGRWNVGNWSQDVQKLRHTIGL
jgi:3D-(3,5/4)-trihydroxycyclohexane-1,2-dione acylhydrolase (decyclizing)